MSDESIQESTGEIAIIGMAGRFPRSPDVRAFWRNLRAGVECIRFWTDEELLDAGIDPGLLADPNYVKAWGYMEGADLFDAAFFDINPREAEITDPQIRLLLEGAWEALEDAGYDPGRYGGRIGVFAGSSNHTYVWTNLLADDSVLESMGMINTAIVNDKDFLATRVSYKLDLRGPSMTVQTACSTSLVAVHLGCQSLLAGESDLVLAGGVTAPSCYKGGYIYNEGGTFSPDGHVRAFDAEAKGMLGGNGLAVVVLKRLEDALADRDSIRAVIKGSALNNDGTHKVSFTAPSVDGQSQVILDALEVAGVDPATISYVECHGTGTPLGDPIEIASLTQAWRRYTDESGWCPIGSVKTNVGHLDTTAGVTGLIKATLALQHREIPPSLNFQSPNPEIDFANSPFFVNTELRTWETDRLPRRAAVSSLGMGGTNAHAILEEAPAALPTTPSRSHQLLLVSARSVQALDEACERLAQRLGEDDVDLADAAFTLHVGRKAFRQRRAVVARDRSEAVAALRKPDAARVVDGHAGREEPRVAFLFSGQGAQYPGMTRGIYASEPGYRETVDRCCATLEAPLGRDLRELLYPDPARVGEAERALQETRFTQPALFVVEYALARLWMEWGITPDAMLGHSIGEYVAACLAGVFSLEDALTLVAERGRLIGELPAGGAMMAVHLPEAQLAAYLEDELDLAAVNAPELCVVSGEVAALARLERTLEENHVSTRRLRTSHAFHSRLMDPVLEAFGKAVEAAPRGEPTMNVVSCSTGRRLSGGEARDPAYWVRHLRHAVRFADGVRTLLAEAGRVLLEVGPGRTLTTLAGLCARGPGETPIVGSTRHPHEEGDDVAFLQRAAGELWCVGVDLDWDGFHAHERRRRVSLPTYPFERQRYWVDPPAHTARPGAALARAAGPAPADRNPRMDEWFYVPAWQSSVLPAFQQGVEPSAPSGCRPVWLLFLDRCGLGEAIASRLRETGREVVAVRSGPAFGASEGGVFTLVPGDPEGYTRLMSELRGKGLFPAEIVHFWGVDPADRSSETALDAIQENGFYSLLFLAQALAAGQSGSPGGDSRVRVLVVTSEMQSVLGEAPACPEKATVLGPCKSMTAELEAVTCRSLDVELARGRPSDSALQMLHSELISGNDDPFVAHRGARRWVRSYEPVLIGAGDPQARGGLRGDGVYLITGGLGGVGFSLAGWLAEQVGAKLVLTARSPLPEREDWDAWLGRHDEGERTSRRIRRVQRLEELGAEVLVLAADCADRRAMGTVLETARGRFGRIDGVIHAAGVPGSRILQLKTRADAEEVLSPKVRGVQVLESLFGPGEPDLLVLCSSISSAAIGMGQVDYFAGNAYLDAYAHHRAGGGNGGLVVAINWDAWQEVGMAVETEVPASMRAARNEALRLGISPREACEAFRRILVTGLPQVLVSPRELELREDFHRRPPRHRGAVEQPAVADGPGAEPERLSPARAVRPRPALSVDYEPPRGELEEAIASLWADLLGLERVGRHDNFFELGGNSLVMMQLNARLRSLFGVSLPIRELFDLPEISLVAEGLESIRAVSGSRSEDPKAEEEYEEFTL